VIDRQQRAFDAAREAISDFVVRDRRDYEARNRIALDVVGSRGSHGFAFAGTVLHSTYYR
jgi:hypothetical protein